MPIPRPAPGKAKLWVLSTIGILLGCGVAVWFGAAAGDKPIADPRGYHVIDDRTVDVTYVVTRPVGRDVTCLVRALDKSFGTVGQVEVHIPASEAASTERTTRVRTTTRAVTGVVRSCSIS